MLEMIRAQVASIERFDAITSTRAIRYHAVETKGGGSRLAVETEGHAPVVLEPHSLGQMLNLWEIPGDHFAKLSRPLQIATLAEFSEKDAKEVTVRAIKTPEDIHHGAARAVVSGKFTPFDILDVLDVAQTVVQEDGGDWEVARHLITRDNMSITLTKPTPHDVSAKRVGDMVKVGITVSTSEVGDMSTNAEFGLWRLACLNGASYPHAEINVKQRHMWIDRMTLIVQLKRAIRDVAELGGMVVRQVRASHDLLLPNLNPDAGKLQADVAKILTKEGIWSKAFREYAVTAMGTEEESSLFGLLQVLTGPWAKKPDRTLSDRLSIERASGKLMMLAPTV